jgi:ABC-type glycerol-3-phosphate transport system substrate-binding protein
VLGVKEPDIATLLASGKAAMALIGCWIRTTLTKALAPGVEMGYTLLPAVKPGGPRTAVAGLGVCLSVNRASKNAEIAFSYARWFTSGQGRALYCGGVGIPPSGPLSPEEDREVAAMVNDPVWKDVLDVQSKATGLYYIFTPKVEEALIQAGQSILARRAKPEDALAQVEAASKAAGPRDFSVPPWKL